MQPNPFTPVRNERVSHLIEQQIKQAIFDNQYPIGEKLPPERELARMFNASRTSVREALRALERSRFVTIKKGVQGGAYVEEKGPEPVVESMKDLLQFGRIDPKEFLDARLMLEPSVAAEASKKAGPKDVAHLRKINRLLFDRIEREEFDVSNDPRFHTEISKIAGNRVVTMMMEVLTDVHLSMISQIRPDFGARDVVVDQHEKIIEAIEKKDENMAFENMKAHLIWTYEFMRKDKA